MNKLENKAIGDGISLPVARPLIGSHIPPEPCEK